MLEKVKSDLKADVPVKPSGAAKRKFEPEEDSTTGPKDAKIIKIDQSTNTSLSVGNTATSSAANSEAKTVNRASNSATAPARDLTAEEVPSETGEDSTALGDDADKWICASCTFRNHPALEGCEVCATSRYAFEMLKLQFEELKNKTSLILPPSHWLRVDPGTRVKRVKLAENDTNYVEIKEKLLRCCSSSCCTSSFQLRKIERIENLHLYQMYSIRKSQMDEENKLVKRNRRMLWHGTPPECVDNIASYGFNRSLCGKNGTKYGKGVYFSTAPCYSGDQRYARPDSYGLQHMFYCRVLTGKYTAGSENMVEPPVLQNNLGRFDSVADNVEHPFMFVIFHDAQAYPEFLVTFRVQ